MLRSWQIEACDGNRCAAVLLSFFEFQHARKVAAAAVARALNDAAQARGEDRSLNESLVQWHNDNELRAGIMGLYSTNSIRDAIRLLEQKRFVELVPHKYKRGDGLPDKTRHFLFQPDAINQWINDQSLKTTDDQPLKTTAAVREKQQMGVFTRREKQRTNKEEGLNWCTEKEYARAVQGSSTSGEPQSPVPPPPRPARQDERFETESYAAVLEVCDLSDKHLKMDPRKRAEYARIAVGLSEDFTAQQIRDSRRSWPFPSPPTPRQLCQHVPKFVKAGEPQNASNFNHSRPATFAAAAAEQRGREKLDQLTSLARRRAALEQRERAANATADGAAAASAAAGAADGATAASTTADVATAASATADVATAASATADVAGR